MKKKDYRQTLRDMSTEQLKSTVVEHKKQSLRIRIQSVVASAKSHTSRLIRRDTARALTELTSRDKKIIRKK